jgi:hypothetical protein
MKLNALIDEALTPADKCGYTAVALIDLANIESLLLVARQTYQSPIKSNPEAALGNP